MRLGKTLVRVIRYLFDHKKVPKKETKMVPFLIKKVPFLTFFDRKRVLSQYLFRVNLNLLFFFFFFSFFFSFSLFYFYVSFFLFFFSFFFFFFFSFSFFSFSFFLFTYRMKRNPIFFGLKRIPIFSIKKNTNYFDRTL